MQSRPMELKKAWIEKDVLYFQGLIEGKEDTVVAGRVGIDKDGYEMTRIELENFLTYAQVMLEPSEEKD